MPKENHWAGVCFLDKIMSSEVFCNGDINWRCKLYTVQDEAPMVWWLCYSFRSENAPHMVSESPLEFEDNSNDLTGLQ